MARVGDPLAQLIPRNGMKAAQGSAVMVGETSRSHKSPSNNTTFAEYQQVQLTGLSAASDLNGARAVVVVDYGDRVLVLLSGQEDKKVVIRKCNLQALEIEDLKVIEINDTICIEDVVELHGLADFNNMVGQVVGIEDTGHFSIRLLSEDHNDVVSVKPENLKIFEAAF
jgi:hypothetical protein